MISKVAGHVALAVASLNLGQIAITLVVLGGATWLAVADKIDSAAVVGLYTLVLGYAFGRTAAVAEVVNGTKG